MNSRHSEMPPIYSSTKLPAEEAGQYMTPNWLPATRDHNWADLDAHRPLVIPSAVDLAYQRDIVSGWEKSMDVHLVFVSAIMIPVAFQFLNYCLSRVCSPQFLQASLWSLYRLFSRIRRLQVLNPTLSEYCSPISKIPTTFSRQGSCKSLAIPPSPHNLETYG
jgi:hypothetical protein